jgi:hypothetical protein
MDAIASDAVLPDVTKRLGDAAAMDALGLEAAVVLVGLGGTRVGSTGVLPAGDTSPGSTTRG